MGSRRYWIGFNRVAGIGPAKLRALLDYYEDIESAWRAEPGELQSIGLDRRSVESLVAARAKLDLEVEEARLEAAGVRMITWEDRDYPELLGKVPNPPPVLYLRGEITEEDRWAVAVVGTRRASAYGREVTRKLVEGLAQNRVTVVSGLARGIDAQAHQAALDAGGRTIAVLGCGPDLVYPPENKALAQGIARRGALLSEYPLGTQPESSNFPPRNRIISGLSLAVLVTEAPLPSGALITTDFAAEQGRDVFAVPGNILNKTSEGTNRLIQDGARLVMKVEDILEELNLHMVAQQTIVRKAIPSDPTEALLLDLLSSEPVHVDEISRNANMPIHEVSSTLALMELKGLVRQVGGMNYVLAHDERTTYTVE